MKVYVLQISESYESSELVAGVYESWDAAVEAAGVPFGEVQDDTFTGHRWRDAVTNDNWNGLASVTEVEVGLPVPPRLAEMLRAL